MIRTARQLKDLIRNLSKEKSADAHILMRNYMMERFLERISFSEYRDRFVLKGGMQAVSYTHLPAALAPTLANVVNIVVQVTVSFPAMKFWIMPEG